MSTENELEIAEPENLSGDTDVATSAADDVADEQASETVYEESSESETQADLNEAETEDANKAEASESEAPEEVPEAETSEADTPEADQTEAAEVDLSEVEASNESNDETPSEDEPSSLEDNSQTDLSQTDSPQTDSQEDNAEDNIEEDNTQEENVVVEDELIYERVDDKAPKTQSPFDRPGKWYVVSTSSGHEKLAKSNLETRIQTMNVMAKVFEVVIPQEEQVELKGGKQQVVKKKIFPGYILVRCLLDDETWHVIRSTPSITGFIGPGAKPMALTRSEVETFLSEKPDGQQAAKKKRPRLRYEVGEAVRVKEGPFTDFQGEVTEINEDQFKVKVLLNIFGRDTPVELEFSQVSKQ